MPTMKQSSYLGIFQRLEAGILEHNLGIPMGEHVAGLILIEILFLTYMSCKLHTIRGYYFLANIY